MGISTVGERRLKRPIAASTTGETESPHRSKFRVGLFGGSFNPAHDGHRSLSLKALQLLELDQVWWLVSPQNPLKDRRDTAPIEQRVRRAAEVANHSRLVVTDIEQRLGTRYSVDTVEALKRAHPHTAFVWLMGADNFASLHRWRSWIGFLQALPVAVFDREPYAYKAVRERAAHRFRGAAWPRDQLRAFVEAPPPAWCLIRHRTHPAASSKIRAEGGWRISA